MTIAASYVAATAYRTELEWTVLRDAASTFRGLTDVPAWVVPFDVLNFFDVDNLWKGAKSKVLTISSAAEFLNRE
jgi:hypothetical protein